MVKGFGYIRNDKQACDYNKVNGSAIAFLILYVDIMSLIENDVYFLVTVKSLLNNSF
jgi:hypothetical protein